MLIGNMNRLAVLIGARGTGKSTFASYLTLKWQRECGAYVIGHSLGGRLPRRLPPELGGYELPIEYHESIHRGGWFEESLAAGVRAHPERWHILAPKPGSNGATADDLLHFAQAMSDTIRKRYWSKKHWGRWKHNSNHEDVDAPPIIVDIDEGIAVESAGVSRKDDNRWFLEFLISLRHLHIGMIWSQQDPTARSWRILEQATDLYVFREPHEWALAALRAAGVSEDKIEVIRTLPDYKHLHIQPGRLDWKAAEKAIKKSDTGSAVGQGPPPKVKTA